MLEHPGFRVLSLAAHRVLFRICIEHAHHGGKENGRLPITYDNFVDYGVHRHSIRPAIRELEALGFIKCKVGRAGNAGYRTASLYELTFRPAAMALSEQERNTAEPVNQTRRWSQRTPTNAPPSHDWKRRATTLKEAARLAAEARIPVRTQLDFGQF
jgi:hypothetical protein